MKTRLLSLPLLLALVASLAACGGGSHSVPANAVAVVGNTPITTAVFNGFLTQRIAIAKSQGQNPTPGTPEYTALRDEVLAYLVQVNELEQQAPKENVSMTQAEVTKFLTNLAKTSYQGSMAKLTAALKKQGLDMATARQEVFVNLLATKVKNKITATAKVTPSQVQAYYNSHKSQFQTPATTTRSVEHILVKSKSLANSIEQKLRNGTSFASLAKKYSKDPGSAAQGGKYTATKGSEVPAYDAVAFTLKTGELSAPVDATSAANGSYGWFIIKALAPVKSTPASTTPFSTAKAMIQQQLLQAAQDKLWQTWLNDLTKEYQGKVSYQSGYAPPTTTAVTQGTVTTG